MAANRANPMPKSLDMRNWRSRAILRGSVKKTGHRNGRDYESLLRRVLASGDPYQVEILRRKGRYQVRITVEEAPAPVQTSVRHGWRAWIPTVRFWPFVMCDPMAIRKPSRRLATRGSSMSGPSFRMSNSHKSVIFGVGCIGL